MHIGIILDGNRRYAKNLGKKPWDGHKEGAKRVEDLIQWALDLNVKEIQSDESADIAESVEESEKERKGFFAKLFSKKEKKEEK